MREAAKNFEFERAAALRDRIRSLKQRDLGAIFSATVLNVDPAATQLNVEPAVEPAADSQCALSAESISASIKCVRHQRQIRKRNKQMPLQATGARNRTEIPKAGRQTPRPMKLR